MVWLRIFIYNITSTIPLRKVVKPEDSAVAVVFLFSDVLAGHVSSEIIRVAGGMKDRLYHGKLKPITEDLKLF